MTQTTYTYFFFNFLFFSTTILFILLALRANKNKSKYIFFFNSSYETTEGIRFFRRRPIYVSVRYPAPIHQSVEVQPLCCLPRTPRHRGVVPQV